MNIGSFLLANFLNGAMAIAMLLVGFFVFNLYKSVTHNI